MIKFHNLLDIDTLRPEAYGVISELRNTHGLLCYMITGDERRTAVAIGNVVGISSEYILAGAKPQDKESFIAALQARGRKV